MSWNAAVSLSIRLSEPELCKRCLKYAVVDMQNTFRDIEGKHPPFSRRLGRVCVWCGNHPDRTFIERLLRIW